LLFEATGRAVRVIAGRLGGRSLVAPAGTATRPTSDRVKEALFSILGDMEGALVLDLYAGTGALGIEALSRGARHATFVEHGASALRALRRNLEALDLKAQALVLPLPAERALAKRAHEFDLVLVDPPYAEVRGGVLAKGLAKAMEGFPAALNPGARLMLEHASSEPAPDIAGLSLEDTRTYGDTALSFYVY
jgi:16S rRNA (guanine(966)-N(2))-methyltransferase RsmD